MIREPAVWDVIVAGAGIAGAGAALDLKRRLGAAASVMLCDTALDTHEAARPHSFRAVAIAPDVRRWLERLGVWTFLSGDAQAICGMAIADGRTGLLPNPTFLRFGEGDDRAEPLAHMVLADPLRQALLAACRSAGVVLQPVAVAGFTMQPWTLSLTTSDGRQHRTRLLAAADGGRSRLRHAARIQVTDVPYPQAALVATLAHDADHGGRAEQHFLPSGPIALLPLRADDGARHRVSLVWTEEPATARRLAELPGPAFCAALQDKVGHRLGPLRLEDRPVVFPLFLRTARRLAATRIALLGDAARVIHPLAGQGLNLGLRDAESLARHAAAAAHLGLDTGSADVLDAYEADRLPETVLTAAGTDLLDRLFSTDQPIVRAVRDVGLGLVDRMPALKRGFAGLAGAAHRDPTGRSRPEVRRTRHR